MKFEIAPGYYIGDGCQSFIIAEGGINHQGDINIAKQLIDLAKESGAQCVKFQKRTIERILTRDGLNRPYDNPNSFGKTYGEHKQALEMSFDDFRIMKQYADEKGILFTASGWDEESVDFLDNLGVPFFKMASADLTNKNLLIHTCKKGKPVILSTGMADMEMVKRSYNLAKKYNNKIVIMQCTSSYPAPFNELDLNVIRTYHREFPEAIIGYSGHENGIAVTLAAVVLGARVVERHFTLDRTMKGGDHKASLEEAGLKKLIRDIRVIELSLGSYVKKLHPSEHGCFKKLTKSVVSKCKIPKGTTITLDMLTTKGPGEGINAWYIDDLIGKKALVDIDDDTLLHEEWFEDFSAPSPIL